MEVCYVGVLKGIAVVADKSKLGVYKGAGSVLSDGSFEGASDVKFEGIGPGEGDPPGIS